MNWPNSKSSALHGLTRGFLQILFPNLCWICRQSIPPDARGFCAECRQKLFADPRPCCPRCAATCGPFADLASGCPTCKDQGFAFDRAIRIGPYEGPLRDVILRCKHAKSEGLAEIVATEWASMAVNRVRDSGIHSVVPVPLHWWRRWQRGYNQSDALARAWAIALGVRCQLYGLRRLRRTAMQTNLSMAARRANVRGAFQARSTLAVAGKTVLLVDDVMTTGSTAHEAARCLRQAGAARVVVAVMARAEL